MKKTSIHFLLVLLSLLAACNNDNSANPFDDNSSGNSGKAGFGVSGLLFENNLVMWDRENQGSRSELFPRMSIALPRLRKMPCGPGNSSQTRIRSLCSNWKSKSRARLCART